MSSDYIKYLQTLIDPAALKGAGDFEAKLTHEERCQILGLSYLGYKRPVLAAAYKVVRPTVGYIVRAASPHYRKVRQEFKDLGPEQFVKLYVTPEVIQKVNDASKLMEAQIGDEEYKEHRRADTVARGPNKAARSFDGTHSFEDSQGNLIQIRVEWLTEVGDYQHEFFGIEAFHGEGWYAVVTLATRKTAYMEHEAEADGIWPGSEGTDIHGPFPTSQMVVRMFAQEGQLRRIT